MKRIVLLAFMLSMGAAVQAGGFGVGIGAWSANSGLDDNDNAVMFGAEYSFKILTLGVKLEGWFVDSSGEYASILGEDFAAAEIETNTIFAADLMWYPVGFLVYFQAGVNYTSLDASNLDDVDFDAIDNQLGLDLGLGFTLFDKLHVQGKIMYTPDALTSDVTDIYDNLDENLFGYMVTAVWRF